MQHNNVFRIVLILNGNRMKQDYTTIAETQGRALQGKRCSLLFAELFSKRTYAVMTSFASNATPIKLNTCQTKKKRS